MAFKYLMKYKSFIILPRGILTTRLINLWTGNDLVHVVSTPTNSIPTKRAYLMFIIFLNFNTIQH